MEFILPDAVCEAASANIDCKMSETVCGVSNFESFRLSNHVQELRSADCKLVRHTTSIENSFYTSEASSSTLHGMCRLENSSLPYETVPSVQSSTERTSCEGKPSGVGEELSISRLEHIICVPEILPNAEPNLRKQEDDEIAALGKELLETNVTLPVVRRFKCDQCEQVFIKKAHLQQHASRHSGERPFKCDVCKATFLRMGHLTMHKRIHSGTRPYKCDDCSATFVDRGTLNKHRRKHTGERPYKCEYCGTAFAQYGHLQQHRRTHNGERPFVCEVCKSRFTRIGHLQGHMRIHTGERPHLCTECGATFIEKPALLKHWRVHTGERPYKCAHCGASFTQKGHMHRHCSAHCEEEDQQNEKAQLKV